MTSERERHVTELAAKGEQGYEPPPKPRGDVDRARPLGVKGIGEIGIVGVAAAIADAVFHATGRRIRDLPITLDEQP